MSDLFARWSETSDSLREPRADEVASWLAERPEHIGTVLEGLPEALRQAGRLAELQDVLALATGADSLDELCALLRARLAHRLLTS